MGYKDWGHGQEGDTTLISGILVQVEAFRHALSQTTGLDLYKV